MKRLPAVLLLGLLLGPGCARIYRPVALALPPATVRAEGLAGQAALQPWGDNSRYERKAQASNLRVAVLNLENTSAAELEVLGLALPEGAAALTPGEAARLVKQQSAAYLLYPLLPGLAALGAGKGGTGYGPSDRVVLQGLAIVGFAIALPNALVAARSNQRLEAFFREQAWTPGPLGPGRAQRGLVFLRSPDPYQPLSLRVLYRVPGGERSLELALPGSRPL